jgi:ribonuclease HI
VTKRFKDKKNPDLWLRFLEIYKKHSVKFVWVKGHANNPLNERCDQLAVEASLKSDLPEDSGYQAIVL